MRHLLLTGHLNVRILHSILHLVLAQKDTESSMGASASPSLGIVHHHNRALTGCNTFLYVYNNSRVTDISLKQAIVSTFRDAGVDDLLCVITA